jgi:hypothetical protein
MKNDRNALKPSKLLLHLIDFFFKNHQLFPRKQTILPALLLLCFSITSLLSAAQCIVTPPPLTCPIAGAIPLTNGMSVSSGNTYTATGVSNFTNITMNGGTLVVCGTLNVTTTFAFNSGNIYVAPGGTLNINHSAAVVFGANSNIYNYGNVTFQVSIVTGTNNVICNCALSSNFTVAFNQMVIQGPNTYFINNGTFNSSFFIVQSTNSANVVCSGPGSVINTGIMINQFANAFNSPNGASCVHITGQIINSQAMTASPNVQICYIAGSVNVVQGPNFGSATVNNNCATCSIPLSTGITEPKAVCYDSKVHVSWTADAETACSGYAIQRSADDIHFDDALQVECQGQNAGPVDYSVELPANYSLKQEYVRLKRTETNGNASVSSSMSVNCDPGIMVAIYPTMVTSGSVTIHSDQRIESVIMYSMDGKQVQLFEIDGDQKEVVIALGDQVAIGQYLLTVKTEHTRVDKLLRVVR